MNNNDFLNFIFDTCLQNVGRVSPELLMQVARVSGTSRQIKLLEQNVKNNNLK